MPLQIINRTKFFKLLKRETAKEMEPAIKLAMPRIAERIRSRFIVYLKNHPVIKGLNGAYPNDHNKDLQAIFGLSDQVAYDAIQQIVDVVENSITVTYIRRGSTYRFFIKSEDDLIEKISNISDAVYSYTTTDVSFGGNKVFRKTKREARIPWLDWLLNGASVEADIEFDLDLATQGKNSRTQRAIMINRNKGDWDFEGVGDFVSEISQSEKFLSKIGNIFDEVVQSEINKL